MKVLLTGANGFLGYYLCDALTNAGLYLTATSRGDCRLPFSSRSNFCYRTLDFTNPSEAHRIMGALKPQWIIHAGAMGKPDDCERDPELATRVNVEGTATILSAAREVGAKCCFISTDFVFDGVEGDYREESPRLAVNHYGHTKVMAEQLVERYENPWSIVRTVLVYGKPMTGRENLLSIVARQLSKGETYRVVDDQIRTPTFVEDLAAGIVTMVRQECEGIYHLSGSEVLTPYAMAVRTARYLGLDESLLVATTTAAFDQPARRPLVTGLCIDKAVQHLGFSPSSFEQGLRRTFA